MIIQQKRLRRLGLLIASLFIMLVRGRADKKPAVVSTILVVLTGKLGDIICGTPVLRAIRAQAPKARIIVGGATGLQRAVLADSGLVDEYVDMVSKGALARVKALSPDAAIVTGPSYEGAATSYVAGIPLVVAPTVVGGFSPSETRPYNMLKKCITTYPYRIGAYAPRERLRALEPLGIVVDDTKKQIGFSAQALTSVNNFFSKNNLNPDSDFIVAITPSAGNKIKEWPEERFAAIADYITKVYNAHVVVLGGPTDKDIVARTVEHMNTQTKPAVATDFTLDELKAFMSKIHLFISADTGPMYIAEAFSIPTIDITGPIDEKEQPPIGPTHLVVVPPQRTKPELFVLNAKAYNKEEALRQVESISVAMVTEAIDTLMAIIKK